MAGVRVQEDGGRADGGHSSEAAEHGGGGGERVGKAEDAHPPDQLKGHHPQIPIYGNIRNSIIPPIRPMGHA
jgi:hypothetical protein